MAKSKSDAKFIEIMDWCLDEGMETAAVTEFFMQGLATISASALSDKDDITKQSGELADLFEVLLQEKHKATRKVFEAWGIPLGTTLDKITTDGSMADDVDPKSKLPEYLN